MNENTLTKQRSFAKTYESLDDYNLIDWGGCTALAQDVVRKVIPNYNDCDSETIRHATNAAIKVIYELKKVERIVMTEHEYKKYEVAKQRQLSRDNEQKELAEQYGSIKVASVIGTNVRTSYLNAGGNPRCDGYESAKLWCVDQGIFDEIERRAILGLPAIGRG
ncbi:hypothetical protein [Carnobacterium maltaromaticum]|uniref:hypothetical protein n=1 Tax=Carnobacterium maltaromaticum TaxID=2751 RepID=UPI0039AF4F9F